jgi:hypothetical protein
MYIIEECIIWITQPTTLGVQSWREITSEGGYVNKQKLNTTALEKAMRNLHILVPVWGMSGGVEWGMILID